MTNGNKITKKEHYIPQTLLKRFTFDGKNICRYDIKKNEQQIKASVRDVCFEKYLYEFKNENNEFILPNYVENNLGKFDSLINVHIKKIEQALSVKKGFQKNVLSEEDKCFWINYAIIQMLRNPRSLNTGEKVLQSFGFSSRESRNRARYMLNVLLDGPRNDDEDFWGFFGNAYNNLSFHILYDDTESIFINEKSGSFLSNSRCGYYYPMEGNKIRIPMWTNIILPLSKGIILIMYNLNVKQKKDVMKNQNIVRNITSRELEFVNRNIAFDAKAMILSAKPLTLNQIKHYINKR